MLITHIRPILKIYSSKFKLDPPPLNKIKTFWKILFLQHQEAAKNSKFFLDHPVFIFLQELFANRFVFILSRPAVCLVVSGPGLIHALAGMSNAKENCW